MELLLIISGLIILLLWFWSLNASLRDLQNQLDNLDRRFEQFKVEVKKADVQAAPPVLRETAATPQQVKQPYKVEPLQKVEPPPLPARVEAAPASVVTVPGERSVEASSQPATSKAAPEPKAVPDPKVEPRPVPVQKTVPARPAAPQKAYRSPESYEPPSSTFLGRAFAAAKDWLLDGNTVLRLGLVLLFIGFAFLLSLVSQSGLIPVFLRYVGVALAALALLGVGWRLRVKRPTYGLTLQGAGIGVLYLTSFAARSISGLLDAPEVFGLLVLVTVFAAILAVLQNALNLAIAAALGGFAAPILVSTGTDQHVALFSYFALLNAGILLIAWFKAWRPLNMIGFAGTFGIGFGWGIEYFTPKTAPELFASTEPFLILFFLMYVGIGLLFARRKLQTSANVPEMGERSALLRWSVAKADYIDGTMIFGPPVIGFGMQCAIVQHIEFGLAFSGLALGLFYTVLALILRSLPRVRLLTEICLSLGVVFGTLAIPLAFQTDWHWTSAVWAVEAAGIYWLSIRQRRTLARVFSLLLMIAAALSWFSGLDTNSDASLLHHVSPFGAALLGAALLFCHYTLRRASEGTVGEGGLSWQPIFAVLGMIFLYLLPPLFFDGETSVMLWAVAAIATIFAGLFLNSRIFLACAVGVLLVGVRVWFADFGPGSAPALFASNGTFALLHGSPFAAALLSLALLAVYFILRHPSNASPTDWIRSWLWVFAVSGLAFFYLIAPLCLTREHTVLAWALAGLTTIFIGLRWNSRSFLGCAFGVQLLAGALFLFKLNPGGGGADKVLLSGNMGLVSAAMVGFSLIASTLITQKNVARRNSPFAGALNLVLLIGLVFVNLALLFILNLGDIALAWAASGLLILWLGLWQRQLGALFYFGLALEAVAGIMFVVNSTQQLASANPWASTALALTAMFGAWRMHYVAWRSSDHPGTLDPGRIAALSSLLLVWGVGWWVWVIADQGLAFVVRRGFVSNDAAYWHWFLLAISVSGLLWTALARFIQWRSLALASLLPVAAAAVALGVLIAQGVPLEWIIILGWGGFVVAHFVSLRVLAGLLPDVVQRGVHVTGVWLLIGVQALAAADFTARQFGLRSAWSALAWALVPSLYLWWAGSERGKFWPLKAFTREYRRTAALPIFLAMLLWFLWVIISPGNPAPLPMRLIWQAG